MRFHLKLFIVAIAALAPVCSWAASLSFSGLQHGEITINPEANTGLDDIYVLYSARGVTASYTAETDNVHWLKYGSYGGGYAEEITPSRTGNVYTITLDADDTGYIIEDGTNRYYCWITNYANHYLKLQDLALADEQDCDRTRLQLKGDASKITYYTINGQGRELSRELILQYISLDYDETTESYVQVDKEIILESINSDFSVPAPLCDTQFFLIGDRFLSEWGLEQEVVSQLYHTIAVEAHASATQEERDNDNEQSQEVSGLGGSAPVIIYFHAVVTDAAIFREWQMSTDPEFYNIVDRYQQLDFDYMFTEAGNIYVRFVANNAEGTCEYYGDTFEVFVGESVLLCPNAFSPGASEGVNDEWKVSYKSIVKFECHIFNRWGQKMATLTDPSQGWDGRYGGKLVPPGAYYYVIKAVGSDGKKYNLSGDINIIRSKESPHTSTNE